MRLKSSGSEVLTAMTASSLKRASKSKVEGRRRASAMSCAAADLAVSEEAGRSWT
jgi:hypothetical protein